MIKVVVTKDKISISGHANYDEYGKDIVCASVSATVITTVNAILSFAKTINYLELKDELVIEIIKNTKETKVLLDNMINLLEQLESNYHKNIKIIYKEV